MRFKEEEQEYRYFPEPDLVPLHFDQADIDTARAALPELPDAKRLRFGTQYGLRDYEASILTASRPLADYFEEAASGADARAIANYVIGDSGKAAECFGAGDWGNESDAPLNLRDLNRPAGKSAKITNNIAKTVLAEMFATGQTAQQVVDAKGLAVVSDDSAITEEVDKVIAANPDVVAKIKGGNDKGKGFLTGQVMKAMKGQARPDVVNRLIDERLAAL